MKDRFVHEIPPRALDALERKGSPFTQNIVARHRKWGGVTRDQWEAARREFPQYFEGSK